MSLVKDSLTLHGGENGSKKLTYSTANSNADAILQTILTQSSRTFQAAQEEIGAVEVKGVRRQGLQRMLISVAEFLGTGGIVAVGVVLLALILGWAAMRIIRRPERTVWLPEKV